MTGSGEKAEGAALWQRWRAQAGAVAEDGAGDNALMLSAYIDGRLRTARADAVEDWLVEHPEALDDVIAARAAARAGLPAASEAIIARAQALVAAQDDTVVPFRRPERRGGWRSVAAWSGVAASLLATSLFGFALGSNAYLDVIGQPAASESTFHQLLDPPGQLFSMGDEESAT